MPSQGVAGARERLGHVLKERWLLEDVVGVGGLAAVYSARHRNGARAAIKLLHGQLSEDATVRERFLREAYLANSIGHSGVVRVLDDDADPVLGPYLVMELLEGSSLLELLDAGHAFTTAEGLDIADQTLDVLAAAHQRGIIHRDLKPANLFFSRSGQVKLLDFGIARLLDETSARLTRTGVPLGTPAYMAPEQARGLGRFADGRADIYALGATLFRLLAGRHVHVGKGAEQIAMVATQAAPRLEEVAPHLPPPVCVIVDHATEFEPAGRYASARDMQSDVRAVRAGKSPELAMRASLRPRILPDPKTFAAKLSRSATAEEAVTQLANAAREQAHEFARRPDAFRGPGDLPTEVAIKIRPELHPRLDYDEDSLPTQAVPPKDMPLGRVPSVASREIVAAVERTRKSDPKPPPPATTSTPSHDSVRGPGSSPRDLSALASDNSARGRSLVVGPALVFPPSPPKTVVVEVAGESPDAPGRRPTKTGLMILAIAAALIVATAIAIVCTRLL